MTQAQEKRFGTILEQRRAELRREILTWRARLETDPSGDPIDQMCSIANRESVRDHIDRLAGLLRQVDNALRELREGNYGVCLRCEGQIPRKRLNAVPWAVCCVSCQEAMEEAGAFTPPEETHLAVMG